MLTPTNDYTYQEDIVLKDRSTYWGEKINICPYQFNNGTLYTLDPCQHIIIIGERYFAVNQSGKLDLYAINSVTIEKEFHLLDVQYSINGPWFGEKGYIKVFVDSLGHPYKFYIHLYNWGSSLHFLAKRGQDVQPSPQYKQWKNDWENRYQTGKIDNLENTNSESKTNSPSDKITFSTFIPVVSQFKNNQIGKSLLVLGGIVGTSYLGYNFKTSGDKKYEDYKNTTDVTEINSLYDEAEKFRKQSLVSASIAGAITLYAIIDGYVVAKKRIKKNTTISFIPNIGKDTYTASILLKF